MTPAKVPLPAVIVSVLAPRLTAPEPDSDLIEVPAVRFEMSKMPLAMTLLEVAMLPSLPPRLIRSSSPPAAMVVVPV